MENQILQLLIEMKEEMTGIKTEITDMKSEIKGIDSKVERVENKVDKNTVLIENVSKKVDTIAEVQKSHMEQNDKQFSKTCLEIDDRTGLIGDALVHVSKNVKYIKGSIEHRCT